MNLKTKKTGALVATLALSTTLGVGHASAAQASATMSAATVTQAATSTITDR